jgi:hypothetical protein
VEHGTRSHPPREIRELRDLEQIVHRPPVHPGGLHPHQGDPEAGQPVPEGEELGGGGAEGLGLLVSPPGLPRDRTQAVTEALWTSRPAHRSMIVSIAPPFGDRQRASPGGASLFKSLRFVLAATVLGA